MREGQKDGEFSADVDPDEFALTLSGLLDGLGVQVTLGQPDVTPARMVERCLTLASSELGCELRHSGASRNHRTNSGEAVRTNPATA